MTENGTNGWRLGRRERVSAGEVAYEVFGEGPPVILVHGTPMWSYLWRNIVPVYSSSVAACTCTTSSATASRRRGKARTSP